MLKIRRTLRACCMFVCLGPSPCVLAQDIIVNKGINNTTIDHNTLRAMVSMRLRVWNNGTPVRVFVLGDQNQLHQRFCKRTLGLLPHRLRRSWDRLVYAGIGQAPTEVSSQEEMRRLVSVTPGAIGYLEQDMIDDSVRQITVQ